MEKFVVNTPLTGEYLTTVRLTTGGLCALAQFDVEATEDFKVCVTESLLILKRSGFVGASITFGMGETLSCKIVGEGEPMQAEGGAEDEISYALLLALIGKVDFEKNEQGRVKAIAFEG